MLRSAKDKANIRKYIIEHFDPTGYSEYDTIRRDDFPTVAMAILTTWKKEKRYSGSLSPSYKSFKDWAQGLPSILDTCYYYNRSAIDDLEETIKAKYNDEEAAADALTRFIYDELNEAVTFKYSVGDIVRFKGWCIDTLGIVIYIENGTMPYLVKIINKGAETEVWAGDEDLEAVNIKK